jgi:hypothetical protein
MLMSATSNEDVERLQKLVLHNPIILNLLAPADAAPGARGGAAGAGPGSAAEIEHFSVHCDRCWARDLFPGPLEPCLKRSAVPQLCHTSLEVTATCRRSRIDPDGAAWKP